MTVSSDIEKIFTAKLIMPFKTNIVIGIVRKWLVATLENDDENKVASPCKDGSIHDHQQKLITEYAIKVQLLIFRVEIS